MSNIESIIKTKLTTQYSPLLLTIINESSKHAGHKIAESHIVNHLDETHFFIHMVSAVFENQSRIERSKLIHATLKTELETTIHALSLKLQAPSEISNL